MVEFELKYKISKIPKTLLKIQSETKVVEDIYYDTENYSLLVNGNFLRLRNNSTVDFKLDIEGNDRHICCTETNFNIEDINRDNISFVNTLKLLSIESTRFNSFSEFIDLSNMNELAKLVKKRKKYTIEDMIISLDDVDDLGLFLEAEMNFDNIETGDLKLIENTLTKKLKKYNLINNSDELVDIGYVELYLLRFNKGAYEKGKFKL